MFKYALLLLVASTTASSVGDTSCYEDPVIQSNQWTDDQVEPTIVLKSNIHAVVYTKTSDTDLDLTIETQIFDAAGMMHEAIFDKDSMTVTVATKVVEDEEVVDPASGAKSVQSSAVAWIAVAMVTMFSASRAPSKISLTVLVVVALAVMTTAVESADNEIDCAVFGKESRVLIVITYPTAENNDARNQEKAGAVNREGLKEGSIVSEDSAVCDACADTGKECVFGLAGQVECGAPLTNSAIEDLVSFSWLDSSCRDTNDDAAKTDVDGIVIFSHGWQSGGGLRKSNPCWRSEWGNKPGLLSSGTEITAWLNAGWQVGQVHWERFADESEVKDAEAKMWRANNDRKNMRYKTGSGKDDYGYDSTGGKSASDLLWPKVKNAIKDAANANVRVIFAGHSLGSQMITLLANSYTVDPDITTNKKIDLWLLDAFFSRGGKSYLGGGTNGNNIYNYVMNIKRRQGGNRVYRTRTSLANGFASGDNMDNLNERVMMTEMNTKYFNQFQQGEKHNVAYVLFLRSISGFRNGQSTPSALNTADKSGQCWWQKEGGGSVATTDDQFGGGSGYKYRYNPPWWKPWYVGCKR